ncbi:MAG: flavodoxin family protein [Pontibacterium sp.]
MKKILAINGSYREGGITDQAVDQMVRAAESTGAEVEVIRLRGYPIEFCCNCRQCTQACGEAPGQCVLQDEMASLIDKIEQADAYILASPTNLGSVTALYKRFMERLTVYAYWPWGKPFPKHRKAGMPKKKAVLISSCAAPGLFGRLLYGTHKQLKMTANIIGAEPVGSLFTGLISAEQHKVLPEAVQKKAQALAAKLV